MIRYKPEQIKTERQVVSGDRIVKNEELFKKQTEAYQPKALHEQGAGTYEHTREKYGPLAKTDPEHKVRAQKDRAFFLNPLLREPLAVEEEERRAIEAMVQLRLSQITAETQQKALEEGFERGRAQGFEQAFAEFKVQAEEKLKSLDQLILEFENAKEQIFRANERFLMNTVMQIARMIILRELKTDPQYIHRLAKELIDRVGVRENIHIRINPDDMGSMDEIRAGIEAQFGHLKNLHIESSSQVTRGSLMIETEWNAIDAGIQTQLLTIEKALLGEGLVLTREGMEKLEEAATAQASASPENKPSESSE